MHQKVSLRQHLGSAEIRVREMTIIYQIFQGVGTMPELKSRARLPSWVEGRQKGRMLRAEFLLKGPLKLNLTTGVAKELRWE